MFVRFQIAILVFMMVQAVVFGVGTIIVLATPLSAFAMQLMPWVVGASALVSAPVSWMIAPRLRTRFENRSASPSTPIIAFEPRP
jgi:hypothetical protein